MPSIRPVFSFLTAVCFWSADLGAVIGSSCSALYVWPIPIPTNLIIPNTLSFDLFFLTLKRRPTTAKNQRQAKFLSF